MEEQISKEKKFKPEFKVKLKDGVAHVPAVPERKQDGSLVMHVPSVEATKKAIKEFEENNK